MVTKDRREECVSSMRYSKLYLIHEVVCEAEESLRGRGVNDTTRISVVLRELLYNAVWYGIPACPGLEQRPPSAEPFRARNCAEDSSSTGISTRPRGDV